MFFCTASAMLLALPKYTIVYTNVCWFVRFFPTCYCIVLGLKSICIPSFFCHHCFHIRLVLIQNYNFFPPRTIRLHNSFWQKVQILMSRTKLTLEHITLPRKKRLTICRYMLLLLLCRFVVFVLMPLLRMGVCLDDWVIFFLFCVWNWRWRYESG